MQPEPWNRPLAALCFASLVGIAVAFLSPPARVSPRSLRAQGDWQLENFALGAVYMTSEVGPEGVRLFGSRVAGDESKGRLQSPWYDVDGQYGLFVSGYPGLPGNRLEIEVLTHGRVERFPVQTSPGEHWDLWLAPPVVAKGAQVRIFAVDQTTGVGGWLGVSEPVEARPQGREAFAALFRILGSVTLAAALALAPGLCLRALGKWPQSAALLIVPGLAVLCAAGGCCWILARSVRPQTVAAALLVPILVGAIALTARRKIFVSRSEVLTLRVYFILVAIAVAKATWSQGPPKELYGGTISRTLERGDRSDSRIPYHLVQLVFQGASPDGELAQRYFHPWSFSHRGPVAGLAAVPMVALAGAKVPSQMPDATWEPFDPEGFAAFRIALIALAASCLLPVLSLAGAIAGDLAGRAAVAAVAGAPFIVHEVYFTWPKLLMAALVLIAFWAVLRARPGLAGLALGAGYLTHPGALLSAPAIALAWPLRLAAPRLEASAVWATMRQRRLWTGWLALSLGLGLALLTWRLTVGKDFQQAGFLVYFKMAGGHPAESAAQWFRARLLSLADTLVPLYAWFHHWRERGVAAGTRAFFLQYWCTVPAGFGFFAFPFFAGELWRIARSFTTAFVFLLALPLLLFAIFWGAADTGLLREGLHPWALVALGASACMWAARSGRRPGWATPLLAARAVEILAMTVVACFLEGSLLHPLFRWTDAASLLVLCGGAALLARETFGLMAETA